MSRGVVVLVAVFVFGIGVLLGTMLQETYDSFAGVQQPRAFKLSVDEQSPFNHVREDQIQVRENGVTIDLAGKKVMWSRYTDSNSMDPVLDEGHNGLEVIPQHQGEVHEGDIVAYRNEQGDLIVHRVVEVGYDEQGWYARTKGDNNSVGDSGKRRFSDIRSITIGILY